MATSYNTGKIVTDGLVLCLDAANPKSYPGIGTTWSDLSGNGNNGTLTNGVGYSANNGGILTFDGVNDYVSFGTSVSNGYITITASSWFYTTSSTSRQEIFGKYPGENGWFMYFNNLNDGKFGVDGKEDASVYFVNNTSKTFNKNSWYNVVFTKQSTNWKLYINGILEVNNNNGNGTTPFNNVGSLGICPIAGNYNTGYTAIVSIYNRALSASEIQQNFQATRSRYGI